MGLYNLLCSIINIYCLLIVNDEKPLKCFNYLQFFDDWEKTSGALTKTNEQPLGEAQIHSSACIIAK